ncbi:hypothetical protein FQN57_006329 [Myotisia sp. PD_48]|nr:hypothetical protein FQN57_006329 [Myotisia sp. PD_48]
MWFFTLSLLCLLERTVVAHADGSCNTGYEPCAAKGSVPGSPPKIGPEIAHLYADIVGSVHNARSEKRSLPEFFPLEVRDEAGLCCASGMQCLLLEGLEISFCWDRFTTNFYFQDGSYGSITTGIYNLPNKDMVNLILGNYTLSDGKTGNIYNNAVPAPNPSTMNLPTPWTSKGEGSAIPGSELGGQATYTTTLEGSTRAPSTIPGTTIAPTTINGSEMPGTTIPPSTIPGTTFEAMTLTVTNGDASSTSSKAGADSTRHQLGSSGLLSSFLGLVGLAAGVVSGSFEMWSQSKSQLFLSFLLPAVSSAFYLPGVTPTSYEIGQSVPLNVNHLTPTIADHDSQLHSVISFDYYHPAFHFCRPKDGPEDVRGSLGSIIFGDRVSNSPFDLHMAKNESCKLLCPQVTFDPQSSKFVNHRIWQGYNVNWLIDGLPAAQVTTDSQTNEDFYSPGFLLGFFGGDELTHLHNHFDIKIEYHRVAELGAKNKFRVVGVLVDPYSRKPKISDNNAKCSEKDPPVVLSEVKDTTVAWTYSVTWYESPTAWATRWDKYLHVYDPSVHWYSLIYSSVFVVLLVTLVSTILLRALRKDIARYNRLSMINLDDLNDTSASVEDGIQEDSGWKLVHGDVFRSPGHPLLLSVLVGNGAQLFVMTGLTVVFALFGLLSPSIRGFLGTVILILYTFLGFVGGYVAARTYKSFGGESWKHLIIATPVMLPVIVFSTFFMLNFFLWIQRSSGAVPFTTMLVIVIIWFVISVPLSVAGSWVGLKSRVFEGPTKVNQIPRQIPPAVGTLRTVPSSLITGMLPFATIFVELYFIMNSLWTNKIYYMFGFLFLCYGLMIMTSASTTILLAYFLLCAEDYRWHWRTFIGAGMTGGYVFINALIFWATRVSFGGLTGAVLYLGYSALLGFLVFVLTGTIGFFASWVFIHRIYGSIKVD